jgi:ADP-ribosyl-[dinitrogen reductase] hydrolase
MVGNACHRGIARGDWRGKERAQIASSGYVVHTLEAALWCIERHDEFEAAVIEAANLADDADTVAATTGQLAGALWGASTIPTRWLEKLAWREKISQIAIDLLGASPAGASIKRAALNEG